MGSELSATPSKVFDKGIGLDLILPLVLLLGSGALQYFSSKMMMPGKKLDEKAVAVTKDKEDDMMSTMRTQSMYMMPLMTIVIGWNFSLGILLYWFVNSAVMLGQQMVVAKMDKKS
jgi:membrane protein insertase Oxa1/YidC/SpoIIIJ